MAYISGHYTMTLDGQDLGDTEDGYTLVEVQHRKPIRGDSGADTELDAIQSGGDVEVRFTYIEYDKIKNALYKQFPAGQPLANVGKLLSSFALVLVVAPVAGTPAAGVSGATKTFHKAVVVSDIETLMSAGHRKGPITFHCYPSAANNNYAYTES